MAKTVPVRVGGVELLVEVTPAAGSEFTSGASRAADYVTGAFERAQTAIEEISVSTGRTIDRIVRRVGNPDQVEVEFGVKISAKGDVIVAGSSAEASLKIKIVYGGGLNAAAEQDTGEPETQIEDAPES